MIEMEIETLRQTLVEAATACNEALPPRIKSSGGVCRVSLEVGSSGHGEDKLRVTLTLDGGYHNTIEVRQPNETDLIRQAVDCVGLLEIWFDANADDFGPRRVGPGVRLRRSA